MKVTLEISLYPLLQKNKEKDYKKIVKMFLGDISKKKDLVVETNGLSSIRLLQLSNYLKVPINYFFEDFSEYLINIDKSKEGHMNVNYNFLVKLYSELNADQKLKFNKSLQVSNNISKVG